MAEDRFDDDGAPPSPDEHDREMAELGMEITGGAIVEEDGEIIRMTPEPLRVAAVQKYLAETMHKYILPLEPMYLEVLIAFANIYAATATLWLQEAEHPEVFQANRDVVLDVVGRLSAAINRIPYAEGHMADLDSPSGKVH